MDPSGNAASGHGFKSRPGRQQEPSGKTEGFLFYRDSEETPKMGLCTLFRTLSPFSMTGLAGSKGQGRWGTTAAVSRAASVDRDGARPIPTCPSDPAHPGLGPDTVGQPGGAGSQPSLANSAFRRLSTLGHFSDSCLLATTPQDQNPLQEEGNHTKALVRGIIMHERPLSCMGVHDLPK